MEEFMKWLEKAAADPADQPHANRVFLMLRALELIDPANAGRIASRLALEVGIALKRGERDRAIREQT